MATKCRALEGLSGEDLKVVERIARVREGAMIVGRPDDLAPHGCFGNADLDEPLFVLRAQDRCAPAAVRDWAHRAKGAGCSVEKVAEAMGIAIEMEEWQEKTGRAKWPD